jgi:hypothetical protein
MQRSFAERLRIAIAGVTDLNELRMRTEEAIIEHDVRRSQTEYLAAAHQQVHDEMLELTGEDE